MGSFAEYFKTNDLEACYVKTKETTSSDGFASSDMGCFIFNKKPVFYTNVTFAGDYNAIVRDNKGLFLWECSIEYAPANCVDVRDGSIIITFSGTGDVLSQTLIEIEENGNLNLPSFETMTYIQVSELWHKYLNYIGHEKVIALRKQD